MKRMIITVVSLVLCTILLIICFKPGSQPPPTEHEANIPSVADTVIISYEEYENTDRPLIAADPDNNALLYGVKPTGVVLVKGGAEQFFDWSYLTPRGILPEITTADFDGDGTNEIGVNLYVGSGTGISVEQLHIVKPKKDSSGNDYFADYQFMEEDYAAQLEELLQYAYNSETKTLTLKVRDKKYEIVCERGFQYLSYTDIVQFRFENNGIKAIFPLGIVQEGVIAEYGYGSLTAGVIYKDEKFTLAELEFDETLDISLLHRKQLHISDNQPSISTLEKYYDYARNNNQIIMLMNDEYQESFTDAQMAAYACLTIQDHDWENGDTKEEYDAVTEKYFGKKIENFDNQKTYVIPETGKIAPTGWDWSDIYMVLKDLSEDSYGIKTGIFYTIYIHPGDEYPEKNDLLSGKFETYLYREYGGIYLVEMKFKEKYDENDQMYFEYVSVNYTGETVGDDEKITPYTDEY